MSVRILPKDVHADSRCRLPLPKREELDAVGQKMFDHHIDPNGGSIKGLIIKRKRAPRSRIGWAASSGVLKRKARSARAEAVIAGTPKKGTAMPSFIF